MNRQRENLELALDVQKWVQSLDDPILENYYYSMNGKVPRTKKQYIKVALRFNSFLNGREITRNTVNQFVASLDMTDDGNKARKSTIETNFNGLRSYLVFLAEENIIDWEIVDRLKKPKIRERDMRNKDVLTLTQVHRLLLKLKAKAELSVKGLRNYLIILTFLQTGIRVEALRQLDVTDVDIDNCRLYVEEKEGVKRDIKISPTLVEVMQEWITRRAMWRGCNGKQALFLTEIGERMSTYGVENVVAQCTADIDKHITPHRLRATAATLVYKKSHDIYMVKEMLGHRSINTTLRYISDQASADKASDIMAGVLFDE